MLKSILRATFVISFIFNIAFADGISGEANSSSTFSQLHGAIVALSKKAESLFKRASLDPSILNNFDFTDFAKKSANIDAKFGATDIVFVEGSTSRILWYASSIKSGNISKTICAIFGAKAINPSKLYQIKTAYPVEQPMYNVTLLVLNDGHDADWAIGCLHSKSMSLDSSQLKIAFGENLSVTDSMHLSQR